MKTESIHNNSSCFEKLLINEISKQVLEFLDNEDINEEENNDEESLSDNSNSSMSDDSNRSRLEVIHLSLRGFRVYMGDTIAWQFQHYHPWKQGFGETLEDEDNLPRHGICDDVAIKLTWIKPNGIKMLTCGQVKWK